MNDETKQRFPMMADAIGHHEELTKHYASSPRMAKIYSDTAAELETLLTHWEETQWRPIVLAEDQKDGRWILGYWVDKADGSICQHTIRWADSEDIGLALDACAGWIDGHADSHGQFYVCYPTHWMPLPKPPK